MGNICSEFRIRNALYDAYDTIQSCGRKAIERYQADSKENRGACMMCCEPTAKKRKCCNALYCDHCYVKNQLCPNCKSGTKQEKLTGATFQMKLFSEHEECRTCLDPGLRRRCCGNYYCDDCYYKAPKCRSCDIPVVPKIQEKNLFFLDRAYMFSVLIGWLMTVLIILTVVIFLAVVIAAEATAPVGLSYYKCFGFFRKCEFHGKIKQFIHRSYFLMVSIVHD